MMLTWSSAGIHPPLRRARALPARGQHQPPQAARLHRGFGAGAVPHARRAGAAQRREHVVGPGGRGDAGAVHGARPGGPARGGRDRRHLGDGQLGPLRRAALGARRAQRALRHGHGRAGPLLLQGHQAGELPDPARRAGGQAAGSVGPALLEAGACAFHVWQGGVG